MYVRLGLANPKEGMTEEALNYFRDVAIPVSYTHLRAHETN